MPCTLLVEILDPQKWLISARTWASWRYQDEPRWVTCGVPTHGQPFLRNCSHQKSKTSFRNNTCRHTMTHQPVTLRLPTRGRSSKFVTQLSPPKRQHTTETLEKHICQSRWTSESRVTYSTQSLPPTKHHTNHKNLWKLFISHHQPVSFQLSETHRQKEFARITKKKRKITCKITSLDAFAIHQQN